MHAQGSARLVSNAQVLELAQVVRADEVAESGRVDVERTQLGREGDVEARERVVAEAENTQARERSARRERREAVVFCDGRVLGQVQSARGGGLRRTEVERRERHEALGAFHVDELVP